MTSKAYLLLFDSTSQTVRIYEDDTQTLTFENTPIGGLTIIKKDADDGSRIKGVEFEVREMDGAYVGTYTTNSSGVIYLTEIDSGWYTITEIEASDGYILDSTPHLVEVTAGETATLTVKNTQASSIMIHKIDSVTGKGIYGVQFLVSDSRNNPIGTYTIREISAPTYYKATTETATIEIEFSGQIVRLNFLNESIYTQVSVSKTGYTLVMPSQLMEYKFQNIANLSNVALNNFYWRDTLPTDGVRLEKIITGTWNYAQTYSVQYKTNLYSDYKVLASNLSTQQSYTLDTSATALSLASGEYITEYIFQFGVVQAGFAQVEDATIFCTVNSWLTGGYAFTNKTDVGGIYDGQWIMATDRWVTTVFGTTTLPKTGY